MVALISTPSVPAIILATCPRAPTPLAMLSPFHNLRRLHRSAPSVSLRPGVAADHPPRETLSTLLTSDSGLKCAPQEPNQPAELTKHLDRALPIRRLGTPQLELRPEALSRSSAGERLIPGSDVPWMIKIVGTDGVRVGANH